MPSKSSAGTSNPPIEKSPTIAKVEKAKGEGSRDLKNAVNIFKAHFIYKVLEENGWNQTESAKEMNIQRTYLSKLIKKLSVRNISVNRHEKRSGNYER